MRRYALYKSGELVGITWARSKKIARQMCRQYTGERAVTAIEEPE